MGKVVFTIEDLPTKDGIEPLTMDVSKVYTDKERENDDAPKSYVIASNFELVSMFEPDITYALLSSMKEKDHETAHGLLEIILSENKRNHYREYSDKKEFEESITANYYSDNDAKS